MTYPPQHGYPQYPQQPQYGAYPPPPAGYAPPAPHYPPPPPVPVRKKPRWGLRIGFTLVIGGAIGNLIDRAVYGHVIDYILFHTPVWSFAIFNLADAFITVGAGLVLLEEFRAWRRQRANADTET